LLFFEFPVHGNAEENGDATGNKAVETVFPSSLFFGFFCRRKDKKVYPRAFTGVRDRKNGLFFTLPGS
jgi:hypothetical protein